MPSFSSGEHKTAVVTMVNPTATPFDYNVVLYMGVNMVVMSNAVFHLEGLEDKQIALPVVMPTGLGTYPVYLDVWSGSALLGHYKAVEDVVIAGSLTGEEITVNYEARGVLAQGEILISVTPPPSPVKSGTSVHVDMTLWLLERYGIYNLVLAMATPGYTRPNLDYSKVEQNYVTPDVLSWNPGYNALPLDHTGIYKVSRDVIIDAPPGSYPLVLYCGYNNYEGEGKFGRGDRVFDYYTITTIVVVE